MTGIGGACTDEGTAIQILGAAQRELLVPADADGICGGRLLLRHRRHRPYGNRSLAALLGLGLYRWCRRRQCGAANHCRLDDHHRRRRLFPDPGGAVARFFAIRAALAAQFHARHRESAGSRHFRRDVPLLPADPSAYSSSRSSNSYRIRVSSVAAMAYK